VQDGESWTEVDPVESEVEIRNVTLGCCAAAAAARRRRGLPVTEPAEGSAEEVAFCDTIAEGIAPITEVLPVVTPSAEQVLQACGKRATCVKQACNDSVAGCCARHPPFLHAVVALKGEKAPCA